MKTLIFFLCTSCVFAQTMGAPSAPLFTGSGLNDASSSGSYVGIAGNHQYTATICASGTPDTVQFARDGGTATSCTAITGAAQRLSYPAGTITGATWSAGRATYTDAGHGLTSGALVTITGASPSGYNVTNAQVVVVDSSHVSLAIASNPGTYTSGGTALGNDGSSVSFTATTGHHVGDMWIISVTASGSAAPQNIVQAGVGAKVRSVQDKLRDTLSVADFAGVDPTGVVDSTAGFQTALNTAAAGNYATEIHVPRGTYKISATIVLKNAWRVSLKCDGWGTQLLWTGNTTGPVVQMASAQESSVEGCYFGVGSGSPLSSGPVIEIRNATGGTVTSSRNLVANNWVNCGAGNCQDGLMVDGPDANNDFQLVKDNYFQGWTNAAAHLTGSQSYSNRFEGNNFNGRISGGTGKYCVMSEATAGSGSPFGASWRWDGGFCGSTTADFYIHGASDSPFVIDGANIETDAMMVLEDAALSTMVQVQNVRWSRDSFSTTADPTLFKIIGGGMRISNSSFTSTGGNPTQQNLTITYNFSSTASVPAIDISHSIFYTYNQTMSQFLPGVDPSTVRMNQVRWDDGTTNQQGWMSRNNTTLGTIAVTNGSTAVVGTGTSFTSTIAAITIGADSYTVASVADATHLTLGHTFLGSTASGLAYVAGQDSAISYEPVIYVNGQATVGGNLDVRSSLTVEGIALNAPGADTTLARLNYLHGSGGTTGAITSSPLYGPPLNGVGTLGLMVVLDLQSGSLLQFGSNTFDYQSKGLPLPVYDNLTGSTLAYNTVAGTLAVMIYSTDAGGEWRLVGGLSPTGVAALGTLTSGQLICGQGGKLIQTCNLAGGDVTTSGGTVATLVSVGSAGSCGDASHSCQITFDGKGRETSRTQITINGGATGTVSLTASCTYTPSTTTSPALCTNAACTTTTTITYDTGGSVSCTLSPSSLVFSGGFKQ